MAIKLTVTVTIEDVARRAGISVEELRRRIGVYNDTGVMPTGDTPGVPVPVQRFRYTPGSSKSGTCPQCAQFIGMLTDGSGRDGVPVPPLHNNCVCSLTPVAADMLGGGDGARRFQWMESLGRKELAEVVGEARADMVSDGLIEIAALYDDDGLLIPLALLELAADTGFMSLAQAARARGISVVAMREMVKVGLIAGARRIGRTEWLVPVPR